MVDTASPTGIATQPIPADITVHRRADGGVLQISPAGILRGPGFILMAGGMGMVTLSSVSMSIIVFHNQARPILSLSVLSLIWIAGISLIMKSVRVGRQRLELAASNGQLRISWKGLLFTKKRVWPAGKFSVDIGPSGYTVNRESSFQIWIRPQAGTPVGLFEGRKLRELEWIAAELNAALALKPKENPE